jgi:Leucine-rich repeat (LRR) protein
LVLFFVIGVIVAGVTKAESSCIVPDVRLVRRERKLDLQSEKIKTICSEAFVGFDDIETLDLSYNELTVLPKDLFKPLHSIENIYLYENNLKTISFDEFASNQELKTLQLRFNKITTIETINFRGEFSITHLYIYVNDLTDVSELCKLAKLELLSLWSNKNLDYSTFQPNCWIELRELNLGDTGLKKLNNDYRLFTGLTKLEILHLGNNNLEVFCVGNFPEMPALKTLVLYGNRLTGLDVIQLNMKFPTLKVLRLSTENWNCDDFNALKSVLEKNGTTVIKYGDCVNRITIPKTSSNPDACRIFEDDDSDTPGGTKGSINKFHSFEDEVKFEWFFHFSCQIGITVVLFLVEFFLNIYFFRL